jgi:hypothetical protein
MLFVGRRRTTYMPPVEGVDDGITGYGVLGDSDSCMVCMAAVEEAMVCMVSATAE